MKQKYRIFVLGDNPPDLKERIATIHASALLQMKNQGGPAPERGQKILKQGKPVARDGD